MSGPERLVRVDDGNALLECETAAGRVSAHYRGDGVLTAGSLTRFDVTVQAPSGLPAAACLALARRWPSDWGTPQWQRPEANDFVRLDAVGATRLRWWNARLHLWHPFDHVLMVELLEPLAAGGSLRVRFGDAEGGSPGFSVQTFIEEASPLSVRLLAADGAQWIELARPVVQIVGARAQRLVLTIPGRVPVQQAFTVQVRAEDAWGNPASLDAPIRLDGPFPADGAAGAPASDARSQEILLPPAGWCRVSAAASAAGIQRMTALVDGRPDLAAVSNPVEVSIAKPAALLAWGDLHAQSVIGCGARSIDDYYRHARDFAATDFGSHQANCFLVSNDEWRETQRSTRQMQDEGRFVTLLGVEWSAASRLGGDHNLYFPGDTASLRRCSHEFVADKSDADSDLPHVQDLYRHYRDSDTIVAVHVGGRTADLQFHEPGLDRLLEVHSTHATSEWFLMESLRRGYRMGVIAGSDSVDGRPGASHPGRMAVRNLRGGLTAVEVPELTRPALWRALRERRCYATTGERILVSFSAGQWRMGDEVSVPGGPDPGLPPFELTVAGTAPIETVDFFRDDQLLRHHDLLGAASVWSDRFRVAWRGASAPGNWQRARMQWDGGLQVSGARILTAAPWAFDTPDEGLTEVGAGHVTWRSVTAGDWDGVVLTLDRPQQALLTFATAPLSVQCRLGDLAPAGWLQELQSPSRMVEIRRLPADDPPSQARFEFRDSSPLPGPHAYWARIRQIDGAYAWTSPIFVDRVGA
jgi:hypothetical protein